MTQADTAPASPSWTVTAQRETTIINPQGQAVDVMAVTFQLTDGTSATVNVPLSSYTVDNVRAAINAKAATLAGVNGLSS